MTSPSSASVFSGVTAVESSKPSEAAQPEGVDLYTPQPDRKQPTGSLRQHILGLFRSPKKNSKNKRYVHNVRTGGNSSKPGVRYSLALSSLEENSTPGAYFAI